MRDVRTLQSTVRSRRPGRPARTALGRCCGEAPADEAYGQAKYLYAWLEDQDVSYVLAIRRSDTLTTSADEQRADALIAGAPPPA
jgi:hypothetical protein